MDPNLKRMYGGKGSRKNMVIRLAQIKLLQNGRLSLKMFGHMFGGEIKANVSGAVAERILSLTILSLSQKVVVIPLEILSFFARNVIEAKGVVSNSHIPGVNRIFGGASGPAGGGKTS